jgi:hypothetical protein
MQKIEKEKIWEIIKKSDQGGVIIAKIRVNHDLEMILSEVIENQYKMMRV